jgi:ABC-type branched-subunit amino acid transport system permease subunit
MLSFGLTVLTFVGFQMILALGMNVLWGFTGLLNLAYIVYYAVGAYVTGVLMLPKAQPPITEYVLGLSLPFPVAALGGLLAAGLVAAILGSLFLGSRLQPMYFPIVTLVTASAAIQFVSQSQGLFNGFSGIISVPSALPASLSVTANAALYVLLVFLLVAVVAAFCGVLRRSGLGRRMRAVREDEVAASAYGINVFTTKLKAHIIGGVIAGLVGALTVVYAGSFSPSGWAIGETLVALSCVFVGGTGNNIGSMIGAAIVVVVFSEGTQLLLPYVPGIPADSNALAIGQPVALNVLLIIILLVRPRGLLPERTQRIFATEVRSDVGPRTAQLASATATDK